MQKSLISFWRTLCTLSLAGCLTTVAQAAIVEEAIIHTLEAQHAQPGAIARAVEAASLTSLLNTALNGDHRSAKNRARDIYRHPRETLEFFGLQPDMKVVEILPGRGWYTELLAPILRENGTLILASHGAKNRSDYLRNMHDTFVQHLQARPELYDKAVVTPFRDRQTYLSEVPDASQDMVLNFRNTHNWIRFGGIEAAYQAMYRVLKPGGILGVIQHRAKAGADPENSAKQGYVPESWLIRLLEDTGFELVEKTELNANPKDTREHPEGVWTLPPSLRLGAQDREKYLAIGESDRMTLKFMRLP